MSDWIAFALIAAVVTFVIALVILLGLLLVLLPKGMSIREGLRLIPNAFRLFKRLANEQGLKKTVRISLLVMLLYLISPVDLIPDVFPIFGSVDDVMLSVAVLRALLKAAGPEVLQRTWPGTEQGLAYFLRVLRLRSLNRP